MSSQLLEKDEMAAKFREVFEAKKASGLATNVAAVEALRWLEAMSSGKTKAVASTQEESDIDESDFVGELEAKLRLAKKTESYGQAMSLIYKVFSSVDELDAAFGIKPKAPKQQSCRRKRKRGDAPLEEEDGSCSDMSIDDGILEEGNANNDSAPRAARLCFEMIYKVAREKKQAVGKTVDNALDALSLELMSRQGDAKAATAWAVVFEYPDLMTSKPKLLRSTFVSMGACGGRHREDFISAAKRSASPSSRRKWGALAKQFFDNLVKKGADHTECLVAARCCDVLREVDDGLDADLTTIVATLNDRLNDEDHVVHEAYRAWVPDEPRGYSHGSSAQSNDLEENATDAEDETQPPEETPGGTLRKKKKQRGSLVFPESTLEANRLQRAGTSLLSYPYLLDAASKARFLRAESRGAMRQAARNELSRSIETAEYRAAPFLAIRVRRKRCVEDALSTIVAAKDEDLRKQLKVQFHGEDGVDEGGVANEFMHIVTKELLGPDRGMFCADEESKALWFSRRTQKELVKKETSSASEKEEEDDEEEQGVQEEEATSSTSPPPPPAHQEATNSEATVATTEKEGKVTKKKKKKVVKKRDLYHEFELVGILLGVAIHNSILVDAPFAKYLFKKLLDPDIEPTLEDLADAAPALARSLQAMKAAASEDDDKEEASFESRFADLSFEVGYDAVGTAAVAELVPGGSAKAVTRENAADYVRAYVRWYFGESVDAAFAAFKRGFDRVVEDGHVWRLLTPKDLELLIRGSQTLDFDALKTAATYEDGYDDDSDTVSHFWRVVDELEHSDKLKLLKFVTGSDRAPIRGLGAARFVISRSGATDQLPSSHTCFSHLVRFLLLFYYCH